MKKENMTSKNFIKRLLITVLALVVFVGGVVFVFDPFYHYHGPWLGLKAILNDKEYQCIGTLRHFDYDTLLVGSSVMENNDNAWYDEAYGVKSIKAIRSYGATADLCYLMDEAYKNHDIKYVFYNIDPSSLYGEAETTYESTGCPMYLYDRNPFNDIQTAQDAVSATAGTVPTKAIMNKNTFNLLAKTDAVKNRFLSTSGISLGYISGNDVKRVMADTNGIEILVYDKQYKDESKVATKFVPDGYVALVPEGALGNTWYGTTPEEADLRGNASASVALVNTGVAITQIVDTHPVNVNTFASEIVLPSYERMDEVAVLKVVQ